MESNKDRKFPYERLKRFLYWLLGYILYLIYRKRWKFLNYEIDRVLVGDINAKMTLDGLVDCLKLKEKFDEYGYIVFADRSFMTELFRICRGHK